MKVKLHKYKKINEHNIFDAAMSGPDQNGYSAYKYSIISLNHYFEQPGNDLNTEHYINVGSYIESVGYSDKHSVHRGIVKQIVKDEAGYILYIIILDSKTSKFIKVSADNIKLLR